MITAIAYIRVSTGRQEISPDAQRSKIAAYASAMDINIVGEESDTQSGKTLDRPGLQRALARLEGGDAKAIIVAKLDRLTRSVRDLGDLVETYFSKDYSLLSVGDSIDTGSAAGRLVLNVLASVAQWEREAIGERTRDALAQLKATGVALGGEAYGWHRVNGQIVDVEDERSHIAYIHTLKRDGYTVREIAVAMNQIAPSKKRKSWHPTTVQRILKREGA